jgi:glycosyltransferase involved in cell wall biosynthesis
MQVLFISDFDNYGGVKTHFNSLIDLSKKFNNLSCTYVLYNISDYGLNNTQNNKNSFKKLPKNILYFYLKYFILFFTHKKIVVSTGNYFKFIILCVLFPNKTTYILHSYPIPTKFGKLKKYFYKLIALRNFKFITVSEYAKSQILLFFKPFKINFKIDVIYNHISFERKNKTYINENNFILTIGHLEYWKNPIFWLETAIQICNKNPVIKFMWIGDGSFNKIVEEKIPIHLKSNIQLLGFKSNVYDYYKRSLLYYQPSLMESFGIATLDAMSLGIPCVVSNVGGLSELIINDNYGLKFQNNNVKDAIHNIEKLINNRNIRDTISINAYSYSHNKFSLFKWEENISKSLGWI